MRLRAFEKKSLQYVTYTETSKRKYCSSKRRRKIKRNGILSYARKDIAKVVLVIAIAIVIDFISDRYWEWKECKSVRALIQLKTVKSGFKFFFWHLFAFSCPFFRESQPDGYNNSLNNNWGRHKFTHEYFMSRCGWRSLHKQTESRINHSDHVLLADPNDARQKQMYLRYNALWYSLSPSLLLTSQIVSLIYYRSESGWH